MHLGMWRPESPQKLPVTFGSQRLFSLRLAALGGYGQAWLDLYGSLLWKRARGARLPEIGLARMVHMGQRLSTGDYLAKRKLIESEEVELTKKLAFDPANHISMHGVSPQQFLSHTTCSTSELEGASTVRRLNGPEGGPRVLDGF